MQDSQKPKRAFNDKTSVMLVAADTITRSAIANQAALGAEDTSYTADYFGSLDMKINNAVRDILGADNAAALREASANLEAAHTDAHHELELTKTFIETKYATNHARRDELLNTLGFRGHYAAALSSQSDMSQLLSRFNQNLTPTIEGELMAKGLPPAHIANLRSYAGTYTSLNTLQEGHKNGRTELTDADVLTLNGIYTEVIGICKMAQRIFKDQPAIRDRFVYEKVAGRQSAFHTGNGSGDPVNPVSPITPVAG